MKTAILDQPRAAAFKANIGWILICLCTAGLIAGCNSSGSNGDEGGDSPGSNTLAEDGVLADGPYAAKGPYEEGTIIRFFELNPENGMRQGAEVAEAAVDEWGAYTFPDIASRWVEAEINGDFFNEYDGSYTDNGGLTTTAIFDLEGSREGRNINLFTHFAAARAHRLLAEGTAGSLESAYSSATSDLQADFNLNHAPEELHAFYTDDLPATRLDDYAALLIASTIVSNEMEDAAQYNDMVTAYARNRSETRDESFEDLSDSYSNSGGVFLNRALENLNALQEENGNPNPGRTSLLWTLSACNAAKAFTADTVVCLDDLRTYHTFSIPPGEGKHYEEIYYYPGQAGMWALELVNNDTCLTSWTTRTLGDYTLDSSRLFNKRINHRLLARSRLNPSKYLLRVSQERDDCSATETELTFRRVAEGRNHVDMRGNVFLENNLTYRGIVGAYSTTVGSFEKSSDRSYYYFTAPTNAGTYRIELNYSDSSSSAMGTHVQYLSDSGLSEGNFNAHDSDITDSVSGESQTREFEATAGTVYRIEVRNTSPTTININSYIANSRFPFDLKVTRQ